MWHLVLLAYHGVWRTAELYSTHKEQYQDESINLVQGCFKRSASMIKLPPLILITEWEPVAVSI